MIKELKQKIVKDAIIKEAKKQFLAKGVQKTTLRFVAKQLGMVIGNLYYYYRTKSDICTIIWHSYTFDYISKFQDKLNSGEYQDLDGLGKIRKYYEGLNQYFRKNPLYAELIAYLMQEKQNSSEADTESEKIAAEARNIIKETLISLYQEGISDGSIKADIPDIHNEAWSFNIAYVAIIINVVRYHEIDDPIYEYFVKMYLERLGCH